MLNGKKMHFLFLVEQIYGDGKYGWILVGLRFNKITNQLGIWGISMWETISVQKIKM